MTKQALDVHYPTTVAWQQEDRAYVRAPQGSEISKQMEGFAEATWDEKEQAWWVDKDKAHLALIVLGQARESAYLTEDEEGC